MLFITILVVVFVFFFVLSLVSSYLVSIINDRLTDDGDDFVPHDEEAVSSKSINFTFIKTLTVDNQHLSIHNSLYSNNCTCKMSDHIEEQEMEAEALSAIYDTAFEITSNEQPFRWSVALYPVDADDADERDELNHVGCLLKVELPLEYPDVLPIIDVEVIKVSFDCTCNL